MKNFFNILLTSLMVFLVTVSAYIAIFSGMAMFSQNFDLTPVLIFTVSISIFVALLYFIGKRKDGWKNFWDTFYPW